MTHDHDDHRLQRESQARDDRERALLAAQAVAAATGLTAHTLVSRRRLQREGQKARCMALYLAHTEYGWPLHRVGAAFDRDRTTVGIACRMVEDLRDDPAFDRLLERLGRGLNQILGLEAAA